MIGSSICLFKIQMALPSKDEDSSQNLPLVRQLCRQASWHKTILKMQVSCTLFLTSHGSPNELALVFLLISLLFFK